MIVSSTSSYAAAFMTVSHAPAADPKRDAPAPQAVAPVASAPVPGASDDDGEAALRERYFEEMISSAADLLLRTQAGGRATRFDP